MICLFAALPFESTHHPTGLAARASTETFLNCAIRLCDSRNNPCAAIFSGNGNPHHERHSIDREPMRA